MEYMGGSFDLLSFLLFLLIPMIWPSFLFEKIISLFEALSDERPGNQGSVQGARFGND